MTEVISYINENKEFFAFIVSFLAILVPFVQYLNTKRIEQTQKNQEVFYEKMLKKFTNQEAKTGLEEQIVVIYDLRNYPQYNSVIKRILPTSIKRWKSELKEKPQFKGLIIEATETLKYLNSNFFNKLFIRFKERYFKYGITE